MRNQPGEKEGVKMYTQTQAFIQPVRERSKQGKGYTHTQRSFRQQEKATRKGVHTHSVHPGSKRKQPGKGEHTHTAFIQAARANSQGRGNTHTQRSFRQQEETTRQE